MDSDLESRTANQPGRAIARSVCTIRIFASMVSADGLRGTEGVKRDRSVVKDEHGDIWFSLNRVFRGASEPRES